MPDGNKKRVFSIKHACAHTQTKYFSGPSRKRITEHATQKED